MAQLTFPISGSELWVDVRINLSAPALAGIQASGGLAPSSLPAKAQIDTGSNVTVVAASIIGRLGIAPAVHAKTQGIGGSFSVQLFRVSLSILDASQPTLPWFTHPDLLVMELPPNPSVDVLIGMDVLLGCRMLVDGPARQFTLDF
jgi:hypothetical protein